VSAVCRSSKPDRLDPFANKAGILAGADVLAGIYPAWEDVVIEQAATMTKPSKQAVTGLLSHLELDRLLSFLLDGGRAVTDGGVHDQLADLQPDQVAAPELAIGCQVEHGQVADPPLALEMETDGPNSLGFERRFGPDEAALVPRRDRPPMWERDT
jgi:hypothetical protein